MISSSYSKPDIIEHNTSTTPDHHKPQNFYVFNTGFIFTQSHQTAKHCLQTSTFISVHTDFILIQSHQTTKLWIHASKPVNSYTIKPWFHIYSITSNQKTLNLCLKTSTFIPINNGFFTFIQQYQTTKHCIHAYKPLNTYLITIDVTFIQSHQTT